MTSHCDLISIFLMNSDVEHLFIYLLTICLNIRWHCPSLGLEWKLTFSGPVVTAKFSKFSGILSAALSQHHLLEFEIAQLGIPSPPLVLFIVMLPKSHLISNSRMSGSRWVITPLWLSGPWRSFLYSSSVYSCHFLIFLLLLGPYHLCSLLSPFLHAMFPWYL